MLKLKLWTSSLQIFLDRSGCHYVHDVVMNSSALHATPGSHCNPYSGVMTDRQNFKTAWQL